MTNIPTCITVICNNIAPGAKIALVSSILCKKDTYLYSIGDKYTMLIERCKTHNGSQLYVTFGPVKCRVVNDTFAEVAEVTNNGTSFMKHTIFRASNMSSVSANCITSRYSCMVVVKTANSEKLINVGGAGFVIPTDAVFSLDYSALDTITDIIKSSKIDVAFLSYSINLDREKRVYSFAIHKYSKITITRAEGQLQTRRRNNRIGKLRAVIDKVIDIIEAMAIQHI